MKIVTLGATVMVLLISMTQFMACGAPLYKSGTAAQETPQVEGSLDRKEGFITVNKDIRLYWFTQGDGEPVLMIHGGPGYPFTEAWQGLDALSDKYRFIYYQQRGSGRSTRPVDTFESKNYRKNMMELEEALGLTTQLRDIEAFRMSCGVEAITVIGHSYGGFLGALYASEYPDRVKNLILIAPAELIRMPMKHSSGLYDSVKKRLPAEKRKDFDAFMKRFFDYGKIFQKSERELQELNHEFIDYYVAVYGEEIAEGSECSVDEIAGWGQHALFFSTGQRYDLTDQLMKIRARTLILTGTVDLASEEEILDTYGKIPSVIHTQLESGHFPFQENSTVFVRILGEFLAGDL